MTWLQVFPSWPPLGAGRGLPEWADLRGQLLGRTGLPVVESETRASEAPCVSHDVQPERERQTPADGVRARESATGDRTEALHFVAGDDVQGERHGVESVRCVGVRVAVTLRGLELDVEPAGRASPLVCVGRDEPDVHAGEGERVEQDCEVLGGLSAGVVDVRDEETGGSTPSGSSGGQGFSDDETDRDAGTALRLPHVEAAVTGLGERAVVLGGGGVQGALGVGVR